MGLQNGVESEAGDWHSEALEEENPVKVQENKSNAETVKVVEPYVGMEFDSEEHAKKFYTEYARQAGFVVRSMQSQRSETDGRILARRLGCNKQGISPKAKGKDGTEQKPAAGETGCKAKIMFKMENSGMWVVAKFIKDHNHPLFANGHVQATVVCFMQLVHQAS